MGMCDFSAYVLNDLWFSVSKNISYCAEKYRTICLSRWASSIVCLLRFSVYIIISPKLEENIPAQWGSCDVCALAAELTCAMYTFSKIVNTRWGGRYIKCRGRVIMNDWCQEECGEKVGARQGGIHILACNWIKYVLLDLKAGKQVWPWGCLPIDKEGNSGRNVPDDQDQPRGTPEAQCCGVHPPSCYRYNCTCFLSSVTWLKFRFYL